MALGVSGSQRKQVSLDRRYKLRCSEAELGGGIGGRTRRVEVKGLAVPQGILVRTAVQARDALGVLLLKVEPSY